MLNAFRESKICGHPCVLSLKTLMALRTSNRWKTFYLGVLAGFYLSFGGVLAYSIGGEVPSVRPDAQNVELEHSYIFTWCCAVLCRSHFSYNAHRRLLHLCCQCRCHLSLRVLADSCSPA